jgi:hypothetical protein
MIFKSKPRKKLFVMLKLSHNIVDGFFFSNISNAKLLSWGIL